MCSWCGWENPSRGRSAANLSGICITRWTNTRTYWSSYQTITRQDFFITIQKVFYCDLFTYICEFITNHHQIHRNWKGKIVFQNSWNYLVVSGFEVIALDDGIFPRSILKELYLCLIVEIDSCHYLRCWIITCLILILSWLFTTRTQQNKFNFIQK